MIDQMLRKIRHFIFLLFAFILLLTACSLAEEAGSRLGRVSNEDFYIGDGVNWSGELTNVDFDVDGDASLPDDYSWHDPSTWGLTVEFTITAKGNFDVYVMNATTEDPSSFYEQDLIDTSFSFPFSTTLSSKLAARAGATVPIRMQGNFTDAFTYRLTWAFFGAIIPTESHDSDFKFTSLQPTDPLPAGSTQFKAFFGSSSSEEVGGFSITSRFLRSVPGVPRLEKQRLGQWGRWQKRDERNRPSRPASRLLRNQEAGDWLFFRCSRRVSGC